MARARNIKPGLFKNEILGMADPLYTLMFEGLWILADREGRLEDRPLRIKAEVFPYRAVEANEMLNWLQEQGFILRYEALGKRFILICEFTKHQNPHKNEPDSLIPPPGTAESTTVDGPSEEIGTKPENVGLARADSGFLIPDSLIPDSKEESAGKPARRPALRKPDDVTERTWMDWLQLRRAKRAPVTETVVEGARGEAGKAGMDLESFLQVWCRRGSQGLEASWLKPEERATSRAPPAKSFAESDREAGMARWEQMTGRTHPDRTQTAIDIPPGGHLELTDQRH